MTKRQTSDQLPIAVFLGFFSLSMCLGCGSPQSETAGRKADPNSVADSAAASSSDGTADSGPAENGVASSETPAGSQSEVSGKADSQSLYSPEAFRLAAHDGKLRVVQVCLDGGQAVDEADSNGYTALAMAAYNGHAEIIKLLIKNKATIDSRDREGKTPLVHAASGPYPDSVKLLLDAGAEIDAVDSGEHFTPLMTASALGNVEVVKVLLAAGAKKDVVDLDGDSALDFAKKEGHSKIAELLEAE